MHDYSKKKEYCAVDNKRIRNSPDLKHTCSKCKNKIRHLSKMELPLTPSELLNKTPKKHHCYKKIPQQQQQQQQQQPLHKIKDIGLNKKPKEKKSLKIIDQSHSHIVNDLNKFFNVENNHINDPRKTRHRREYKENDQHIQELLRKNNDSGIKGKIYNLLERMKIKPDPKQIDIIYTRPVKNSTENWEEESKNALVKHSSKHSCCDDEKSEPVKKDMKDNKTNNKDNEIKEIKKIILEEIKSDEQKFNSRKKLLDRFQNFNGILDSELTVANHTVIARSQVGHHRNTSRSVSVAVPAKSFYKMDIACQVSKKKLTEKHHPPVSYIPPTDLQNVHHSRNRTRSVSLPSKIPVAVNQKLTPLVTNDKDDHGSVPTSSRSRSKKSKSPIVFRNKTFVVPPKVVEIQYLTDLIRGKRNSFSSDCLNQKYCNFEYGKEHLKIEDQPVQENQDTDSTNESPREHKLKIKDHTFNINLKTQTKIHICQKSKRFNTRKYRKGNRSCSRKKSAMSIKEKQVSNAATNTEYDIGNLDESLNQLLRDNLDFLMKDFSYLTESSKFDKNCKYGKTNVDNNDRVLSLTTLNQNVTSVKIENEEKMVVDFSTVLNSKNDYFTLKSIEDVLNQLKLEDYGLKSDSLTSLESKDLETNCSYGSIFAYCAEKKLGINEEICPKKEISFAKSLDHLEDRRNGRSEFGRFFLETSSKLNNGNYRNL